MGDAEREVENSSIFRSGHQTWPIPFQVSNKSILNGDFHQHDTENIYHPPLRVGLHLRFVLSTYISTNIS